MFNKQIKVKTMTTKATAKRQAKSLLKKLVDRNDAIVLVEDGVETSNSYPLWAHLESCCPDTKTVDDWIDGIFLHYRLRGEEHDVSFVIKRAG